LTGHKFVSADNNPVNSVTVPDDDW
jgi:hypothetical protein